MNKKLGLFLIVVFSIVLVSAAWYFVYTSNVSIRIDSLGSQRDVILNIPPINLNTTENSASGGGATSFAFNKAGSFRFEIIETFGDLSGGECLEGNNDCSLTYRFYDGNSTRIINNSMVLNISSNQNTKYIFANISCVAYSCPQTRDIIIKLYQTS